MNIKKFVDQVGQDIYINLSAVTYFKKWDENHIYISLGTDSAIVKSSIEDFCKVMESVIRRAAVMK